jgi:hypothetical protein
MGKMNDALKRAAEKKAERDKEVIESNAGKEINFVAVREDKIRELLPPTPSGFENREFMRGNGTSFLSELGANYFFRVAYSGNLSDRETGSPTEKFIEYLRITNEGRDEPVTYLESKVRF